MFDFIGKKKGKIQMIGVEDDEDNIESYIKLGYSEDDAKFLYEFYKDYKPHCTIGTPIRLVPTISEILAEKIGRFLNKIMQIKWRR